MSAKINPAAESADFANLVTLISMGADADARLGELQNDLNQAWIDLVDARRKDYAELQQVKATAERAIQDACEMHPEWFAKARSLKTPYGSVNFRRGSKLEVKNEEASIILLEQLGSESEAFIRQEKHLDLEALEKLPDSELERIRIRRVETESFSIRYAKPDLGKAVAAAVAAPNGNGGES